MPVSDAEVMLRVPEPELMTGVAQVADYAAADFSELHAPMLVKFRARFPKFAGGRLLDLGCGAADMTIRFAQAYPELRLVGIDGSEAMLTAGQAAVDRASLNGRITLQRRLISLLGPPNRTFDAVIANSLLHHLTVPMELWEAILHAAKPGAPVMVMDLCRPPDIGAVELLVARYGAEARPALRRDFLHSLCAAYTPAEVRRQLDAAGLDGFEVTRLGELHLLVAGEAPHTSIR